MQVKRKKLLHLSLQDTKHSVYKMNVVLSSLVVKFDDIGQTF